MADLKTVLSIKNRMLGFVMSRCSYHGAAHDQSEVGRKKAEDEAKAIIARVISGDEIADQYRKVVRDCQNFIVHHHKSIEPFEKHLSHREKDLETLAVQLPVYERFIAPISGIRAFNLALIVAATDDLSNYPTHSAVWKRMGLAPYRGKACATWRSQGGLTDADWVFARYKPSRRAVVYNVGVPLIMHNKGIYKQYYNDRKAYEIKRAEAEGITVIRGGVYPKGIDKDKTITLKHIGNRAQRYMEQRFMRNLYYAWKAA